MAKTKQTAARSTGGRAPATELARKAAKQPRGAKPRTFTIGINAVRACRPHASLLKCEDPEGEWYFVPVSVFPDEVAGFVKCLPARVFSDDALDRLAALELAGDTEGDGFVIEKVRRRTTPAPENRVYYEGLPSGVPESSGDRAGPADRVWYPISLLSLYGGSDGEAEWSFADVAQLSVDEIRAKHRALVTRAQRIMRVDDEFETEWSKEEPNLDKEVNVSRKGGRLPSAGPVQYREPLVDVSHPSLSDCAVFALASLVSDEDRRFADEITALISNTFSNFVSLRQVENWLRSQGPSLAGARVPYRTNKCLPRQLWTSAREGPEAASNRLAWLLSQNEGRFLVVVCESSGHKGHVVGVDAGRRVILDPASPHGFEFTKEGFDFCCGGSFTCVGLDEIRGVERNLEGERALKRSRVQIE